MEPKHKHHHGDDGRHGGEQDGPRRGEHPPGIDPANDPAEQKHFDEVAFSFSEYQLYTYHEIARRHRHVNKLAPEYVKLFPGGREGLLDNIARLTRQARVNQEFLLHVVRNSSNSNMFLDLMDDAAGRGQLSQMQPSLEILPMVKSAERHMSKVRSTLHQCAREWSLEGKPERDACYHAIIDQLETWLPITRAEYNTKRVLVPGVGLGRLCTEICGRGYACQGNEFSYFMLIASSFILNQLREKEEITLYPWIDNPSNVKRTEDMFREVRIPDVPATEILANNPNPDLSMCAGDFVEVYGKEEKAWDSLVSCFFLDTASNVFEYITTIHKILKPGGVWVNFGPLLWHWQSSYSNKSDRRYEESVELSYEQVKSIIETVGFEFKSESWQSCKYAGNCRSMMNTVYDCVCFTCVKK